MKAIIYDKKASPDKLVVKEVDKPVPDDNQVLIKIHAVSLNAADYRMMSFGFIPKNKIFGADVAGVVEAVGKNISRFRPGDEVFGENASGGFGGLAEYAVISEKELALKPAAVSFEDAAALPIAALTVLQSLRDKAKIKTGDKVLIIGSGGGVGTYAIQFSQYFGAEVTAVCSTKNVEQSKVLGAGKVIDYTSEDFLKTDERYNIILAVNGNYPLFACLRLLKPGGKYILIGGAVSQLLKTLLFGWLVSIGSKKAKAMIAKNNPHDLEFIAGLVADGKIKPVIENIVPLEKSPETFRYLMQGHVRGKLVIKVV